MQGLRTEITRWRGLAKHGMVSLGADAGPAPEDAALHRKEASAEPSTASEYSSLLAHYLAHGPMAIKDLGMLAPRPSWLTESLGQFLRDNGFSARALLGV